MPLISTFIAGDASLFGAYVDSAFLTVIVYESDQRNSCTFHSLFGDDLSKHCECKTIQGNTTTSFTARIITNYYLDLNIPKFDISVILQASDHGRVYAFSKKVRSTGQFQNKKRTLT